MRVRLAILAALGAIAVSARADALIQNVQQALKDQGFYYGEVTGSKDVDTSAAIRRYQIRNGLQITGDLNDETLKSLGVDSSGVHAVVKASPTAAPVSPAPPDTSDLREEKARGATPTNPLTGQPFPQRPQDRETPARPDYSVLPGRPAEHFAGTPYANSPPDIQEEVIAWAQNILARQGLYRGMIDGTAGPELEFSLRAYQSRAGLPQTGRLDLDTLAALQLLPGAHAPIFRPHRRPYRESPVRGEWIPER
jgi:peptidoglycan hydrolase-like protein with peptidoglycan-binding domain